MVHKIVYNCARSEGSNGKCVMPACVCVIVCVNVLKKVSPSSPGHSQDFCLFVLYQFSLEHASLLKHWLCDFLAFSFRVRMLLFLGEKRWIYWYIGNIGFTRPGSPPAACGFCILMVWRGHGGKKFGSIFVKDSSGLKSKLFSVPGIFGSCPVLKSCRNGRQIAALLFLFHY